MAELHCDAATEADLRVSRSEKRKPDDREADKPAIRFLMPSGTHGPKPTFVLSAENGRIEPNMTDFYLAENVVLG